MRGGWKHRALWTALVALALAGATHPEEDHLSDPDVQKVLRGMADASTWYHPDLFGEFAGMRHYAHREYHDAFKYFEIGAYYADKLSQLSIGLMYLNGEGTKKDPVTAYAWLDLAAERDYPEFIATRDNVKRGLTPEQLANAVVLRKTLGERYADAVAKPRMVVQLRQGRMQMTGSHTGFDTGIRHADTSLLDPSNIPHCGATPDIGGLAVPQAGCGSDTIYAKERWEPDLYFNSRDRQWKATVTVGAIEEKGEAIDKPPAPAASVDVPADKGMQQH